MEVVTLNKIAKRYGERIVFDAFDLIVHEGDFLAVTGASGKGKTTLLNIIGLLEKADSGDVTIFGKKNPSFDSKTARNIRRYDLAYLFQNFGLIDNETVKDNMMLSLEFSDMSNADKNDKISETLRQIDLSGFENRKIYTLSGGEQQRVALGKIFLKSPKLILADEPTGSLDPDNRDYILSKMVDLNKQGITIIIVTHDETVVKFADKAICL